MVPLVEDQLAEKITVSAHLFDHDGRAVVLKPQDWVHTDQWDLLLCPSVLVSRKEVLLLLAERLWNLRTKKAMYQVASCPWTIGRHVAVTTSSGVRLHYYGVGTGKVQNKFQTWVEVLGFDQVRSKKTSRLACVICGIQLKDFLNTTGCPIPETLRDVQGIPGRHSVTFLLV